MMILAKVYGEQCKQKKEREERKRRKKMGPILFLSLLIHLSISTQAEHDESYNDKEASNNGARRQGLIF